jgi:hypothetical protein
MQLKCLKFLCAASCLERLLKAVKLVIESNSPPGPECSPRPPIYEIDLPNISYVCMYVHVCTYVLLRIYLPP